ncbi:MAG: alpha/beta hydrolase family protein [Novosphingobium sp.]
MRHTAIFRVILALLGLLAAQGALAEPAGYLLGEKHVSYTDESRPIKASMGFAGSPTRRLDVLVWYPAAKGGIDGAAAKGGPWPLLLFSHGTYGHADGFMHIVNDLVAHGYVVAAPDYPLTSRAAWTRIKDPDISDVAQQVRDDRFLLDRLIADPAIGPMIDKDRIAAGGHSLGAVTSYFLGYGVQTRDPRVKALVLVGAGDPVQAALSQDMGLFGTAHAAAPLPVLFLSAEKDVFARMMGRAHAAYFRVEPPKYEVMVKRGAHVWFHAEMDQHPQGKNPDCLFFERMSPTMKVPGCEGPEEMIDPVRQQAITLAAMRSFLDGYLKRDAAALSRLRTLDKAFPEAELILSE